MGLTGMGAKMLGTPPFGVGTDVAIDSWEGCGEIVGAVGLVTLRSGAGTVHYSLKDGFFDFWIIECPFSLILAQGSIRCHHLR